MELIETTGDIVLDNNHQLSLTLRDDDWWMNEWMNECWLVREFVIELFDSVAW